MARNDDAVRKEGQERIAALVKSQVRECRIAGGCGWSVEGIVSNGNTPDE
jgi:hypothetical protein